MEAVESAFCRASCPVSRRFSAFRGWCVLCGCLRKHFCIQLSKRPRRFPAGFDLAVGV